MSRKLFYSIFVAALMGWTQQGWTRISILSPWTLQDRLPTKHTGIDQQAQFQFGMNGVTPSGGEADADFINFPYQISYGVLNKLEIGAGWGLSMVDRKNRSNQFGITDIQLGARYRFFEPNRQARTAGLDLEAGFSFPSASFDKGLGTGALGFLFGWGLVLPIDPAKAFFGLGYRYNLENSDDIRVGSVFSYNGGVTIPLKEFTSASAVQNLSATAEIKGFNHSRNKRSGESLGAPPDELYLSPGLAWEIQQGLAFYSALLIGLTTDSSDIGMNLELRF